MRGIKRREDNGEREGKSEDGGKKRLNKTRVLNISGDEKELGQKFFEEVEGKVSTTR